MGRRAAAMNSQQQAQVEKETGKSVDDMSDEELEAELAKRGIGDTAEGGTQASGQTDYSAELEKLAELRDKGILTEEEFQAKKKQVLGL
jgi:hypothetical protein